LASQKGQLYSTGEYGNVHAMENMLSYSTAVHTNEIEYGPIHSLAKRLARYIKAAGAFQTGLSAETMWDYPILHAAVIEFGDEPSCFEKDLSREQPGRL
jgi:hypothetical protein